MDSTSRSREEQAGLEAMAAMAGEMQQMVAQFPELRRLLSELGQHREDLVRIHASGPQPADAHDAELVKVSAGIVSCLVAAERAMEIAGTVAEAIRTLRGSAGN